MTYDVFSRTLNPTQSIKRTCCSVPLRYNASCTTILGASVPLIPPWVRLCCLCTERSNSRRRDGVNSRMFPTIRVSFGGHLDASSRYTVLMDVVAVDSRRYRYAYHRSTWLAAGKADPPAPCRLYVHPDSPFNVPRDAPDPSGRLQTVSFEKLKLTNNTMDNGGRVRYVCDPSLCVVCVK